MRNARRFNFTDEQINAALAYIKTNRAELRAEYQIVLKEATANG